MRYALVLLVALTSCNLFAQKIPFKVEKNIKGEVVVKDLIIGGPSRIFTIDSLLFVQDVRSNGNKYLKVYNLENGKLSRELGNRGRGPGELMTPMISYIDKEEHMYYLSDINVHKIHLFGIDNSSGQPDSIIDISCTKKLMAPRCAYLNDSIIICSGWFKDGLLATINYKSNEISFSQEFPFRPFDGPSLNIGRANGGSILLTPDRKHLIYSCLQIGYVACYNIDGICLSKKWEQWLSKPKYKLEGKRIVFHSRENLLGCMDFSATNDKVFCIYEGVPSGMIGNMDPKNSPKTIITFSMKGEPLGKYHADRPIIRITPDGNRGVYCVSEDPEYNVVRYKL